MCRFMLVVAVAATSVFFSFLLLLAAGAPVSHKDGTTELIERPTPDAPTFPIIYNHREAFVNLFGCSKHLLEDHIIPTRMHSSRMRIIRCSGCLMGGWGSARGCLPWRCPPRGVCLPRGCLPRGLSAQGGLPRGVCPRGACLGVSAEGGCLPRGVSAQKGCLPRGCTPPLPPTPFPMDRQTPVKT